MLSPSKNLPGDLHVLNAKFCDFKQMSGGGRLEMRLSKSGKTFVRACPDLCFSACKGHLFLA